MNAEDIKTLLLTSQIADETLKKVNIASAHFWGESDSYTNLQQVAASLEGVANVLDLDNDYQSPETRNVPALRADEISALLTNVSDDVDQLIELVNVLPDTPSIIDARDELSIARRELDAGTYGKDLIRG